MDFVEWGQSNIESTIICVYVYLSLRSDLPDGGSEHFAETVREIKKRLELMGGSRGKERKGEELCTIAPKYAGTLRSWSSA